MSNTITTGLLPGDAAAVAMRPSRPPAYVLTTGQPLLEAPLSNGTKHLACTTSGDACSEQSSDFSTDGAGGCQQSGRPHTASVKPEIASEAREATHHRKQKRQDVNLEAIEDSAERKRQRRLAQNRATAAVARVRKRDQFQQMADRVAELEQQNVNLNLEMAMKDIEVTQLKKEVAQAATSVTISSDDTSAATLLMENKVASPFDMPRGLVGSTEDFDAWVPQFDALQQPTLGGSLSSNIANIAWLPAVTEPVPPVQHRGPVVADYQPFQAPFIGGAHCGTPSSHESVLPLGPENLVPKDDFNAFLWQI